jgi:hypothetical protein
MVRASRARKAGKSSAGKMPSKGGSSHPGFAKVQSQIASKMHVSKKRAGAILASKSRSASSVAKKRNPRLLRVRGK